MHALAVCFAHEDVDLHVATVNHNLRPEAVEEAKLVETQALQLGLPHQTLSWEMAELKGNLQDQARRARYRLLTNWAKSHGIEVLALGHTADDQAETVLMRLSRASGVHGLSAMPAQRSLHGVTIMRPLLGIRRERLRSFLRARNVTWAEDPSNEDDRFDRVRIRKALAQLSPLGIDVETLAQVAANMGKARETLDWYAFMSAREIAHIDGGDVVLDLRGFRILPDEVGRQLIICAIRWITGSDYPPRRAAVADVLEAIKAGRSITLQGCRVARHKGQIWIFRELNAVKDTVAPVGEIWDRRWRLFGIAGAGMEIRPLGRDGLGQCETWRETGRPYASLTASPSVWQGDTLVAAPLARHNTQWQAALVDGDEGFFAALLSH